MPAKDGFVVRARGRRVVSDGPDLMFYTNAIRVVRRGGPQPARIPNGASTRQPACRRHGHFLALALAWTAFAIYGSLVPLNYQPIEWAVAVERFRNLPPLWFGMGSRADWVANILLFVPVTFLWMGAITCDRGRAARALRGRGAGARCRPRRPLPSSSRRSGLPDAPFR